MQSVMKARTTLQLNEANFEWTIEKWSRNSYLQTELLSHEFQLVEIGKTFFGKVMLLKPSNSTNRFAFYFETCKELQKSVIKAYVLKATNEKVELKYNQRLDNVKLNDKNFTSVEFLLDEQRVIDDTLTIFCSINYVLEYCGVKNITRIYNGVDKAYAKMMTLNGYDKLFKNQELCDVTFLVGKQKIKAHIAILAATSSYFLAMFTHENMKESKEKIVDFTKDSDITPQNFKGFLECIYGCKSVADLSNIASEILVLADKFEIKQLQESCETYLSDVLNEQNVAKTLLFADKYRCVVLKEKALNFAKAHMDVVKDSVEFDDLCKNKELMRLLL